MQRAEQTEEKEDRRADGRTDGILIKRKHDVLAPVGHKEDRTDILERVFGRPGKHINSIWIDNIMHKFKQGLFVQILSHQNVKFPVQNIFGQIT